VAALPMGFFLKPRGSSRFDCRGEAMLGIRELT
jgi:hypothetical protein